MINTVLLEGHLTEKVLDQAFREIDAIDRSRWTECSLIVSSNGGDLVPAMEFMNKIRVLGLSFPVKVYNAQSSAAFITLSLRHSPKMMKRGTIMGLHRGRLKVEAPDLSPKGEVPKAMLDALLEYNKLLDDAIGKSGITDPKLLAEFYGRGWIMLSADDCLKYGIVQRLF